jgi:hypothetical protein
LFVEVPVTAEYFGIALPPTWAHEAPLTATKATATTLVNNVLVGEGKFPSQVKAHKPLCCLRNARDFGMF